MTSIARKLLDELMGPDRNKPLQMQGQSSIRYTQPDVCKYSLIDFCPFELFLNTKSDIGQCPFRIHDPMIKEEFEKKGDPEHRKMYERLFYNRCWDLIGDLEKKLKRAKDRLDMPDSGTASNINDEMDEKRALLEHQIKEILAQVERLGEEGHVMEAQERMVQADLLQAEIDRLKQVEADNPMYRLEKKMELCPTCGAFLIVNDAPMRIQAHYSGRQHNGWVQLRNALEKYKARNKLAPANLTSSSRGRDDRRDNYTNRGERDHNESHRGRSGAESFGKRRYSREDSHYYPPPQPPTHQQPGQGDYGRRRSSSSSESSFRRADSESYGHQGSQYSSASHSHGRYPEYSSDNRSSSHQRRYNDRRR
jgi:hypothetical protein